ncbi:acylphosphatase [Nocardiopsis sp. HNM0947]|uniref:acylphosphatase n=1 Tax=Nocardiopsis coralli TaxID=2772213 RepID=A0ABR9P8A9_9ACTN|nr:acylphosphatase [Nocardiopsis coralli]MBE3000084.1 acylphosphatase [Nocardiopsis coralli]
MNENEGGSPEGTEFPDADVRLTAWVRGHVQGVGFRWWARARALEEGLVGAATNLSDGRVEVVAEGHRDACERLLGHLRGGRTPGRVDSVVERWARPGGTFTGFVER